MISYHFGGKGALYNEILRQTFPEAHRRFAAIRDSDAPADERLRALIQSFADLSLLRPALPAMVLCEVMSGGLHIEKDLLPKLLAISSAWSRTSSLRASRRAHSLRSTPT